MHGIDHAMAPGGPGHGFAMDLTIGHAHGGRCSFGRGVGDHGPVDGNLFTKEIADLDPDAIADTLMLSYDHGSVARGGQPGYDVVDSVKGGLEENFFSAIGPARPFHTRQLSELQLQFVKELAADPRRVFFAIHCVHHAKINLAKEFESLAVQFDCLRIDRCTPNFFGEDETLDELADWNIWHPPFTRKRVPAAWYPDATGKTHVWKQYWQVIRKPTPWWLAKDANDLPEKKPGVKADFYVNLVLEVQGVTWHFAETDDYETRFQIKVVPLPLYNKEQQFWTIREKWFKIYQKKARELAEAVLVGRLKNRPPTADSVRKRQELFERLKIKYRARFDQVAAMFQNGGNGGASAVAAQPAADGSGAQRPAGVSQTGGGNRSAGVSQTGGGNRTAGGGNPGVETGASRSRQGASQSSPVVTKVTPVQNATSCVLTSGTDLYAALTRKTRRSSSSPASSPSSGSVSSSVASKAPSPVAQAGETEMVSVPIKLPPLPAPQSGQPEMVSISIRLPQR